MDEGGALLEDAFSRLEKALQRALERMRSVQQENDLLRQQAGRLKQELEGLKGEEERKCQLLEKYESDRVEIRSRVAKALDKIAGLEGPR